MKPVWKDGVFRVELHKPDISALHKARDIGAALIQMAQTKGSALVQAIDEVLLGEPSDDESDDEADE